MAARRFKNRPQFYVYQLENALGEAAYIGKGSGRRLRAQELRLKMQGYELARFWLEEDAYKFERAAIAERQPFLNRHPGGNGSRVVPKPIPYVRPVPWQREMDKVGTRVYAARILLARCLHLLDPSIVDEIRAVAHG